MRFRPHFRVPMRMYTLLLLGIAATALYADAPPFDLAGPKVDVHVQRDGKTLPIAQVPNLLSGDRLWIHPDLPESQSTHYVLVVAFLRGSTNPPPAEWYRRVETWNRQVREEGVFVVVPPEAQQALIFLAPETIGDFSTLKKAVHDRPGAFVRAAQDLQAASWDRLRLDAYLAEVKSLSQTDPKVLKERTELAARSLGMRIDQQCFDKPSEQQAPCLVQHTDGLVLDDSNAPALLNNMANGAAGDLMNQVSYSNFAGAGAFSPYVGAVLDLARIFSSMHTAKFQYIPALALPQKEQEDTLNLRLNVPPSFRDPKSVIVVALPPIGPPHPPQMHPAELPQNQPQNESKSPSPNPGQNQAAPTPAPPAATAYCATKPKLAFSADGAPLVFGTNLAHDLVLHIETKAPQPAPIGEHSELVTPESVQTGAQHAANSSSNSGPSPLTPNQPLQTAGEAGIDIPIRPDPTQGGFILEEPIPTLPEAEVVAEVRGKWGFDDWEALKFHLVAPHPGQWSVPPSDLNALITGREDQLHIQGPSTLCVAEIEATFSDLPASGGKDEANFDSRADGKAESGVEGQPVKLAWKSPKPDLIDAAVPLKDATPGLVTIGIYQYGLSKPEKLPLKAYAEASAIEHLSLSVGDRVAVLKGRRLDEVEAADLAGISFTPAALNRVEDYDQLEMSATGVTSTLRPGSNYSAKVILRDGRTLHVPATVGSARPQVELLSKGVQHDESDSDPAAQPPVHLGSPNDLPLQRRLVFFLRSRVPVVFARTEKVEIASIDGSFSTTLSLADGSLMLEDTHTAVAVIDPLARFGASAFGPIQLRAISADGVTGDWVPLGTLVRLPGFTASGTNATNSPNANGNATGSPNGAASASKAMRCPRSLSKPCQLTGTNLFLITEISASPDMENAVEVPGEFTGTALSVPNTAHASSTGPVSTLYLRLRDDPETVQTLNLPVAQPASQAGPSTTETPTASAPVPNSLSTAAPKPESASVSGQSTPAPQK